MYFSSIPRSLFNQLLFFFGMPLLLLGGVSVYSQYINVKSAATQAYDRTLLASARTVAERLIVKDHHLVVDVPYVVLDSFERNTNDRFYYQVISPEGETISGYNNLPSIPSHTLRSQLYTALSYFYDAEYQGQLIRVVALYQPINEGGLEGMALILVAETVNSRQDMIQQLLFSSLVSQGTVVILTLLLAYLLLKQLLKPVIKLAGVMASRSANDLTLLSNILPWPEFFPLIQAINGYIQRLKLMIRRQERFSADASHQLKTPLTVLKTQLAVILNNKGVEQRVKTCKAINKTVDNMIILIDQLLYLSKFTGHEKEAIYNYQPVNIVELLQQVCFSRWQQAESKNIDLGYEGKDFVWLKGEPVLLAEMSANLLDNALKYTPNGGMVTVRVRVTEDKQYCCLEVDDSGPGISQEEITQSLMAFNRLDNAAGLEGSGLGLAIVKDISLYHGASLQLLPSETLGGLLVRVLFKISDD